MGMIVITGAEQGLGLELARLYAEAGHDVLAGCLNPGKPEIARLANEHPTVKVVSLDVTRRVQSSRSPTSFAASRSTS